MTNPQGEGAQRTYDRRRARNAAEQLAQIPPNRWDATTKRIVITLATMIMPSAIDHVLEAGALAVHVDVDAYDRARLRLEEAVELAQPAWSPRWHDIPDGTTDLREAFAAEFDRMGLTADERDGMEPAALCGSMHGHDTIEQAKACDDLPRARAADAAELDERETVANGVIYRVQHDIDHHNEHRAAHDNGDYRA